MNTKTIKPLEYSGVSILLDPTSHMICLNQLWHAVNKPKGKDPKRWLDLDQSELFLIALEKKLNADLTDILRIVNGRNGGIWGHWQVALAYAKYLDPHLHIQVNEWARRFVEEEIYPEQGVARAIDNWKRQGKNDAWIKTRLETKQIRHQFTSCLAQHGVSKPFHYAHCTDAINKEVLGGTAKQLKQKMGLTKSQSLRDSLSRVNIAALGLAEALAEEDIEDNSLYGYLECLNSCQLSGSKVKRALN